MATGGNRLDDEEYVNWLLSTLSLIHMKEGLEEFTDNQSVLFHKQLLTRSLGKATHSCKGNCKSADIKKDFRNHRWYMTCPDCDSWLQTIISFHKNAPFPILHPANTHPNLWKTEPWEIMKIFIGHGCETHKYAKDADMQGMLSLFINCKHFSTGSHIGRQDLLDELLRNRNSLLHSANFKVIEADMKNYLQTVLLFMQGMTGLAGSEKDTLEAAIDKVKQLEANQIEISVNKDLELRALQERQVALDRDLRALVDVTKKEQDRQSTELKAAKRKFDEFLEDNDLVGDVSKLSKRMGDIDQTIAEHAKRISTLEGQEQSKTDVHIGSVIDLEEQRKAQHHCDTVATCLVFQQLKHQQVLIPENTPIEGQGHCALPQQLKHQTSKGTTPTSKPIQDLKQHLLDKYGEENKYWVNPMDEEEVYLSEMYVQPSVKRIREINEHGQMKEVKDDLKPQPSKLIYKDIFQSKSGEICKNVYITGDAGTGKSTFCNRLVLNWCTAMKNDKNQKADDTLAAEDQELLSAFRFLFHINLRDNETTYHVEDMIQKQFLSNVPESLKISDILKNERCLVLIDGLDEWSCPPDVEKCTNMNKKIPGRNTANKNCIFITTTRNWKFDVIELKNKDVDKHVELCGIDKDSAEELAQKLLGNLNRESETHKSFDDFDDMIEGKNLKEYLSVPVLLVQLVTLWFFGKDFGNSQSQLYCSMLELMFERSEKNLPEEITDSSSTAEATSKKLPECFSTKDNCQKYAELLHCLSKLAYKALFNKQKEEALVFKSSKLEIFGISPSNIKLCLHCGILSQCKDYGNRLGKYKKFSFLHKKVQECLAALYLVTNDKAEDIPKEVKQLCNSVETMLEMNQVWLFVAGMDRDMTRQLLEHLGDVVSGDERVKTYRQTVGNSDYDSLIRGIQRCVSDCVSEGINNGHRYENVCLQDFRIDRSNVRAVERLLFCSDMSKVKSVYIRTYDIDAAKLSAITGQFLQCRSIQRLHLSDSSSSLIPDSTVTALVDNNWASLTALYLWTEITAPDKLVTAICSSISKSLMALGLWWVKLRHKHLEQILASLSQSRVIRQLELKWLDCTDHDRQCRAKIDCSAMTRLQKLTLSSSSLYVVNLPSLPHCVEKVELTSVTLPVTSLRDFARGLSQTKRKVTVELQYVTLTETREERGDLEGFLQNCPGLELTQCEYSDSFNTWRINFHTSSQ